MKTLLLVWSACTLLAYRSAPHEQRSEVREEAVVATYAAEWDGAWYEIFFGKLFGKLPTRFTFKEMRWIAHEREEFFIELADERGEVWVRVHSDTSVTASFVDLPRKPRRKLGADAVRFIREIKRLMADTTQPLFQGMFRFGASSVTATAARVLPDTAGGNVSLPAIAVVTHDTSGAPSIYGFVEFARNPHILHYPTVFVAIPEDGITATLREISKP